MIFTMISLSLNVLLTMLMIFQILNPKHHVLSKLGLTTTNANISSSTDKEDRKTKPKLTLTRPKGPVLQTSLRAQARPHKVKSSLELELEEIEKIRKFRAKPLNKKLSLKSESVPDRNPIPRVPKANPYPYTTDYHVIPPKPEPKQCTKPTSFQPGETRGKNAKGNGRKTKNGERRSRDEKVQGTTSLERGPNHIFSANFLLGCGMFYGCSISTIGLMALLFSLHCVTCVPALLVAAPYALQLLILPYVGGLELDPCLLGHFLVYLRSICLVFMFRALTLLYYMLRFALWQLSVIVDSFPIGAPCAC